MTSRLVVEVDMPDFTDEAVASADGQPHRASRVTLAAPKFLSKAEPNLPRRDLVDRGEYMNASTSDLRASFLWS